MKTTTDRAAWLAKLNRYSDIARRIASMRNDRARELCRRAGLSPDLLGIHPHNAMCGYNAGQPWPNVDYKLVRQCLRLLRLQWQADEIVAKWYHRTRNEYL